MKTNRLLHKIIARAKNDLHETYRYNSYIGKNDWHKCLTYEMTTYIKEHELYEDKALELVTFNDIARVFFGEERGNYESVGKLIDFYCKENKVISNE